MSATATAPKRITLTQALVTRYAKLSALKNLIDKWLDDHKQSILQALDGQSCPDKGPYLLESKEVRKGPNYKDLYLLHLCNHDGMTQQQAEDYLEADTAKRDWGTQLRLEKKINPNYRKTFTLKLPA